MPKQNSALAERQRLLKPLLHFFNNLPARLHKLSKAQSTTDTGPFISELQSHINTLRTTPALFSNDTTTTLQEIDRKATALWNQGTRLKRELQDPTPTTVPHRSDSPELQALALVRVFTFLVLDATSVAAAGGSTTKGDKSPTKERVRLMRVAVKAAKSCLEFGRLEYCTKVLERAADHEEAIGKAVQQGNSDGDDGIPGVYPALRSEYFVLRMTLAWKQNNLQLAEVMRSEAVSGDACLGDPAGVEALADALFEIGRDLFGKGEFSQASKWLEKSYDAISAQELDRLSPDAGELKLAILHYLVRALLSLKTDSGREKARNVVALMESESTERIVVSLLRLDLIASEEIFDSEQYYSVLNRIMRMTHLTPPIFKTIMSNINKLKDHNPEMACKALDDFLNLRLYADEKDEWIERCFITRLWIAVDKLPDNSNVLETLQTCFASMLQNFRATLTTKATHAAQTLIWKRVDALFRTKSYDEAESWCRLALHRVLSNAGEINTGKINRKILLCQINRRDYAGARATFNQMAESVRSAPMTRHIMYKLAIRDYDITLAAECIDEICKAPSKDSSLLYACVVEAYSSGDKQQAIAALQKVLSKYNNIAPNDVHLPSLIRCTVKLLISEIPGNPKENSNVAEEICNLFDGAVSAINKNSTPKPEDSSSFDEKELEWFVTNSYNLALNHFDLWRPDLVVRLFEACVQFSESPNAKRLLESTGITSNHVAISNALAAQQLLQLARAEDNQAAQLQYYLKVRKHIKAFHERIRRIDSGHDSATKDNMGQISRKLSPADFEAAIHLKNWDDLTKIVNNHTSESYQVYADMILASDAPPPVIFHTLEVRFLTSFDSPTNEDSTNIPQHITSVSSSPTSAAPIAQQARYLRILCQLSLTHQHDAPSALTAKTGATLARALDLARAQHHNDKDNCYPPEELEYLATTTFNRAIDAYCARDGELCRQLGGVALEFAKELEVGGGGPLVGVLMERLVGLGLGFGEEGEGT